MKLIVAVDKNWGIGKNNGLLFRLPKDMKFFRETTTGKVVVVGANTFKSFPSGALPNRTNVVLDASGVKHEGTISVSTLEQLRKVLENYPTDQVYVIGGAAVYALLLAECSEALVTKVDADGSADVFFPDLDKKPDWALVETRSETDNGYFLTFCRYVNKKFK